MKIYLTADNKIDQSESNTQRDVQSVNNYVQQALHI